MQLYYRITLIPLCYAAHVNYGRNPIICSTNFVQFNYTMAARHLTQDILI